MKDKASFSIHTLGCKVNQYEGEQIIAEMEKYGWRYVDFSAKADVYIINSCTVTSVASHKSRQLIRRAIKKNPEATVIVTGCYADSDRKEIASISGVDLVLGNEDKSKIPYLLFEKLGIESMNGDGAKPATSLHTRALVKVQDGCNQFCSYCIVPHVRSNLWSRPIPEVFDEVNRLVAGGTQEVVLTGIHLGLYGANTGTGLGDLLARLVEIPQLGRIRLSSIELNEVTPQIIDLMTSSDKLCNHLHIPLQSGSNRILKAMNRHYTAEEFAERTDELKSKIKDLAITTDIIVGFPGETERDFEDSIKLVKKVGFSKLHVFKFSPRKGTPAATYPEQIPGAVKDERSAALIDIGRDLSASYASSYLGKRMRILVEREQGKYLSGMSDNYIRVYCEGPREIIGKLVTVEITKQEETVLYGSIKSSQVAKSQIGNRGK
ncbi:MAG: tRNA (N(6)-L-threonylcarbamoyladenosine(37)-C(2))-methylthiotransferase MtaB [Actinomycetota bacterium]|nr:tRNA (N(6)-L-threonylcarbamoyladenosine(37)-C(2))-methylthiotransferase MtaB [Actinomycetota bacterium]